MIKDEVEPIGGFIGDAFVQPVFLGGQALTALASSSCRASGSARAAVHRGCVQGVIIPRLRASSCCSAGSAS